MNVIEEDGFYRLDVDRAYTISDTIALLEFMKDKFGDCEVLINPVGEDFAAGFCEMKFENREEVRKQYFGQDIKDAVYILF